MDPQPWHRLFGLSLMDFFRGQPVTVELEKDLSLKVQLLDVVILRWEMQPLSCQLPDGFDPLGLHNLVTFKSYQEALDAWTLSELVGHWVNYRKQVSPTMQELLPVEDFRLYAVCVRYPQGLSQTVTLRRLSPGVYEVDFFSGTIRVIVVNQLPETQQNAMMHLFSANTELVRYGATHHRLKSNETSTLLKQLLSRYRDEGAIMPDALEEFTQQVIQEIIEHTPAEVLLKGLSAEERLKSIPPEERLADLSHEERLRAFPAQERLQGLSIDELLAALTPEQRELIRRLPPNPDNQS